MKRIAVMLIGCLSALALLAGCAGTPTETQKTGAEPDRVTPDAPPTEAKATHETVEEQALSAEQLALKERYPAYFGIDASNGLDVIVWQMAEGCYDFGLLMHTGEPRELLSDELMSLTAASAEQMRAILSTYGVDQSAIYILPWQNPFSSYIPECWIVREGESKDERIGTYIAGIRAMLFESPDAPVTDL